MVNNVGHYTHQYQEYRAPVVLFYDRGQKYTNIEQG